MTNLYGITPLHYACYFGNKRAIDLLLDLGADINARDDEGNTCLHYAINSSCLRTIKKLIIRGVDKSIKRKDNLTAFDISLKNNEIKISNVLKTLTFFDKYICMRTELVSFSYTRNDIILSIVFSTLCAIKTIYLLKLFFKNNHDKIKDENKCRVLTSKINKNNFFLKLITAFLILYMR